MHQDAQKFSTVGRPRSADSFRVGEPLKPSNVQSGSCLPDEVRLCGVHGGNFDADEAEPVHATPARHRATNDSLSARMERF
jgi:hypothetical protein